MKYVVIGGDGFCGWPTVLGLLAKSNEVLIIDNLSRRKIDIELGTASLTDIATIDTRISAANETYNNRLSYLNIDISSEYDRLVAALIDYTPDCVIHFGEQRAAPYSMIDAKARRYTVDNNVSGTHNLLSAIVQSKIQPKIVHLGTMGVYGYTEALGSIPEGYLDIIVKNNAFETEIVYPPNPGSIYHLTKVLDHQILQYYAKNWGLDIIDLHQGIVWGIDTEETVRRDEFINRFDFCGIYGTVLNRFIVQAANDQPLTVYGTGGQTRAFIHIQDTVRCIQLASTAPRRSDGRVAIFNQISETHSIKRLANLVSSITNVGISYIENPRNELPTNKLEVTNEGLISLGFEPIRLTNALIDDVSRIAHAVSNRFDKSKILNSPKWK